MEREVGERAVSASLKQKLISSSETEVPRDEVVRPEVANMDSPSAVFSALIEFNMILVAECTVGGEIHENIEEIEI